MNPILTRCGYRCDLCLAYRPNVAANPDNPQKLSDGWFAYFGFRIPPAEIICDGCLSPAPHRLIDVSCPVRPCVMTHGLAHCAECDVLACEKLAERLVTRQEVEQRIGRAVPEADYQNFILPYENKPRLDALRASRSKEKKA
ncbi:MAG TPA: DUF3795 domain-containing protein [Anaerolineaceae bacterium]|nr:DUF3795 domain-containing protein [Anaerolineaceae bacterium]